MRNLAKEFETLGGFAVDAPVTGSLDAAIRGDMIMFVGGSEKAISNAKEVLEVIGENLFCVLIRQKKSCEVVKNREK